MKRYLTLVLMAVALAVPSLAGAVSGPQGPMQWSDDCADSPSFGGAVLCYDTAAHAFYYLSSGTYTLIANGASATFTSPLVLNGTSSGHINVSSGATPTAYTLTYKASVPVQGALATYSNGTGQIADLADVATGQVLASGGVATVPAYTATPSVTTVTASGTVDKTLNVSNGGHISNPIGTGTPPTAGTGSVTAGSTDSAMTITGATSPVTITFGTAFAVAPVCVCSNVSTAADGCKTSSAATGTIVVTTASTDSFTMICMGK
jgi:hypothetical protein